ncbi:MAG TPA: DUF3299 domain-containing protein [Pirellulales bacterium]|jgi:hypothetical protein
MVARKAKIGFSALLAALIVAGGSLVFVGLSGCSQSSPASQQSTANLPTAKAKPTAPGQSAEATAEPQVDPAKQPARDITFDAVKFDMKKEAPFERSMITPAIEKLTNKKIRVRGYIYPSFQQTGITDFVLVRDNLQCCFGPSAALYDCIVVKMDAGKTIDFTTRPIAVEGVFSIDVLKGADDRALAIYHLQAQQVQ